MNAELLNDFVIKLTDKEIGFSEDVLNKTISLKDPSGKTTVAKTVAELLQQERKAMRWLKTGGAI